MKCLEPLCEARNTLRTAHPAAIKLFRELFVALGQVKYWEQYLAGEKKSYVLGVLRFNLKTYGSRCFTVAAPTMNSFPLELRIKNIRISFDF